MADEVNDPLAWLDQKHPHVGEMDTLERWQRWRAVLDEMDTDEAKKKFLPRTEIELDGDYDFRIKTAEFLGVTDAALDRVTGAVFGTPAKIETENKDVDAFVKDCDGSGQPLVEFFESMVSPEAQGMGICFVAIDKAKSTVANPANKLQEVASGANKCFATLYTAEEITNWGHDENGMIEWCIISRSITTQDAPDAPVRYFAERRLLSKTEIRVYRKELDENGKPKDDEAQYAIVGDSVLHGLGEVPIVPIYGKRHGHMRGWCVIPGTVRSDIQRFGVETWHALGLYRHANQLLTLKSPREIKEIVTGHIVRLMEDEEMAYVSPSGSVFEANENAIKRLKQDGVTQSGMNPASTSDGPNTTTGESGIAQRVRFTHTEKRTIEQHARQVETGIRSVLRIVEKYFTGREPAEAPSVTFYTTFDTSELPELMNSYQRAQFWIQSPTWHRAMLKQIATKSLPDLDDAEKETIGTDIDQQGAPVDPSTDPRTQNLGN